MRKCRITLHLGIFQEATARVGAFLRSKCSVGVEAFSGDANWKPGEATSSLRYLSMKEMPANLVAVVLAQYHP